MRRQEDLLGLLTCQNSSCRNASCTILRYRALSGVDEIQAKEAVVTTCALRVLDFDSAQNLPAVSVRSNVVSGLAWLQALRQMPAVAASPTNVHPKRPTTANRPSAL